MALLMGIWAAFAIVTITDDRRKPADAFMLSVLMVVHQRAIQVLLNEAGVVSGLFSFPRSIAVMRS